MSWHAFAFHVALPPEGQPMRWWADILILDQVIGLIVKKQPCEITAWYVHRRSVGKAEATQTGRQPGHIFRFECQTAKNTAECILQAIEANQALQFLRTSGILEKVEPTIRSDDCKDELHGESGWDPLLRRVWVTFVCGISETLLRLAYEAREERRPEMPPSDWSSANLGEVESLYVQVNARVATLWARHWRDLVHHFRALLGYPEPPIELVNLVSQITSM